MLKFVLCTTETKIQIFWIILAVKKAHIQQSRSFPSSLLGQNRLCQNKFNIFVSGVSLDWKPRSRIYWASKVVGDVPFCKVLVWNHISLTAHFSISKTLTSESPQRLTHQDTHSFVTHHFGATGNGQEDTPRWLLWLIIQDWRPLSHMWLMILGEYDWRCGEGGGRLETKMKNTWKPWLHPIDGANCRRRHWQESMNHKTSNQDHRGPCDRNVTIIPELWYQKNTKNEQLCQ